MTDSGNNSLGRRTAVPSWWDAYSAQPYTYRGADKPKLTTDVLAEYAKIAGASVVHAPKVLWQLARLDGLADKNLGRVCNDIREFVGIGVTPPPPAAGDDVQALIEDLGARHLLIRVPLWDIHNIDHYTAFASRFPGHELLVNVLQDRDCVNDLSRWRSGLQTVLSAFAPLTHWFQIGNAINRKKWGCAHSGDYLALAEIANELRDQFPGIKLAGSSVIDFEPHITLRTLHNDARYWFDACASALYVNRRGSPYAKQFYLFDLNAKIAIVAAILAHSNRCAPRLWITETNWPLLNTQPYTPNSGHPRSTVDEQDQARYLRDYFRIAWSSGLVERVYWWQLVNPGYGLVDHRGRRLRKMPAYHALRELIRSPFN